MSTDSRAYAWCSLGPLEAGSSIAESHVQGSGVITLRGTINLAGVYRPATGTVVSLAYSDGQNWLARLPLRLRVLSSLANPLGRTTAVSVGCDLAYFEDRKSGAALTVRQANPDTPEAVWRAATPSIPATWLVEQILSALGLTAAGTIPLSNHKTIQEFDLSAGYVEELGKLAVSEGYAVRMTPAGLVEFVSKSPGLGSSVLLSEDDLIDFNPINTGTLPAESVFARYTTLQLKKPDGDTNRRNWEREETLSPATTYFHNWTRYDRVPVKDEAGNDVFKQAKNSYGLELWDRGGPGPPFRVMEQVFEVKATEIEERISSITRTIVETKYDDKDRVSLRTSNSLGLWGVTYSETYYSYGPDGEVDVERTSEWSPLGPLKMSLGLQATFSDVRGVGLGGQYQTSYREVRYERDKVSGYTKTVTINAVPYITTPDGGETISRLRDGRKPWDSINSLMNVAMRLVYEGSEVRIRTEREFGTQKRPSEAERTATANLKAPTVEQKAEATWAVGSAATQTSLELSPPYAPDDRIVYSGGTYSVIKSDAAQKVLAYATTENRLLLGHRNGVGIQVLPEQLPPSPLGLLYIRLNGCTAAFRSNGTTWNLDPSGVTATTDALFWGAIDGTVANAWFPLPADQGSLPAAVAVTTNASPRPANAINIPTGFSFRDPNLTSLFASLPSDQAPVFAKTVNPSILVRPYHETIEVKAGSGSGVIIASQPWIPQTIEQRVGGGGGVIAESSRLLAGGGGGIDQMASRRLLIGGGGGAITSITATAMAGGGGGVIASDPTAAIPMLSFTGGASDYRPAWANGYGLQFTLASAKTVKAIGVWDAGSNGLSDNYTALLGNSATDWAEVLDFTSGNFSTLVSFDAAGSNVAPELLTSAYPPLDGVWRRFDIAGGRTLPAGTYTLLILYYGMGTDHLIKNAATVTPVSGVTFVENVVMYDDAGTNVLDTVSEDGLGYFGAVLFF